MWQPPADMLAHALGESNCPTVGGKVLDFQFCFALEGELGK